MKGTPGPIYNNEMISKKCAGIEEAEKWICNSTDASIFRKLIRKRGYAYVEIWALHNINDR